MPAHDYICRICSHREELTMPLSQEPPETVPCTSCGRLEAIKAYDAEGTTTTEDAPKNWSDGHTIFQLPPNCPDRQVSSQKEMDEKYQKYGISPDNHMAEPGRENESGAHRWKKSLA